MQEHLQPDSQGLLDVFVGVNVTTLAYDVHIVGRSGAAFNSTTPLGSTTDPNFMAPTPLPSFIPRARRSGLHLCQPQRRALGRRSGLVLAHALAKHTGRHASVMPFSLSPTGTTASLHGLSAFGNSL